MHVACMLHGGYMDVMLQVHVLICIQLHACDLHCYIVLLTCPAGVGCGQVKATNMSFLLQETVADSSLLSDLWRADVPTG